MIPWSRFSDRGDLPETLEAVIYDFLILFPRSAKLVIFSIESHCFRILCAFVVEPMHNDGLCSFAMLVTCWLLFAR